MSAKALNGDYSNQCDRFDLLDKALQEQPENTVDDCMRLLEAVKQEYPEEDVYTEWSVVYHLDDFTVDYAVDMKYDTVYSLNPKEY